MVTRVTGSELKEIIATNLVDDLLESQFIDTANVFVDAHLLSEGLSDPILKKIELYLAAHFLAITEERGGLVVDHAGEATQRYSDVYKAGGLQMTRYGQMAIQLDSSNTLRGFTSAMKAEFRVV